MDVYITHLQHICDAVMSVFIGSMFCKRDVPDKAVAERMVESKHLNLTLHSSLPVGRPRYSVSWKPCPICDRAEDPGMWPLWELTV